MPSRLTLQLHPDWPHGTGTVIASIARDGEYRSQFATGISNGGLTAHPGGDRWRWESRLFEGRYDTAGPEDRPVYGAWNRRDSRYGGAVRFGSAHLRLRTEVVERATFCFPDSVMEPEGVFGHDQLHRLCASADASGLDELDDCVEAHVHGGVSLSDDVEAIVLDPCFRDTAVEADAARLGCAVEWHPGFWLSTADLDPAFRGPEVVALARALAAELTPAVVGDAARSGRYDPQRIKQVWHHLARFGRR